MTLLPTHGAAAGARGRCARAVRHPHLLMMIKHANMNADIFKTWFKKVRKREP